MLMTGFECKDGQGKLSEAGQAEGLLEVEREDEPPRGKKKLALSGFLQQELDLVKSLDAVKRAAAGQLLSSEARR